MNPRTVEDIITDFKGRRSAIVKALTKDFQHFHQLCNPNLQCLSLYAFPNQQWIVNLPPPNWDLPYPKSGINLVRDSMNKHQWLSMLALHSNAWLYSVASYFATMSNLDNSDLKRLFNKITDFCSVLEAITGGSRKRDKRDSNDILGNDLMVELLSRVSVRDVLRCRLVCKRWRTLIDDPLLISTHLSNYKCSSEGTHLLLIEKRPFNLYDPVTVRCSDTFRKVMVLNSIFKHSPESRDYRIWDYVKGVMLIMKGSHNKFHDIILWNPSINKTLNVPNPDFSHLRKPIFYEIGLGFDASSNDLKVVAIVYPHAEFRSCFPQRDNGKRCDKRNHGKRYRGKVPGLVQVYRLSTKSWNNISDGVHPPPYWSVGPQVFVNGGIHWMNLGPEIRDGDSWSKMRMRDSHIVSFDVSNEVFNYMELPSEVVENRHGMRLKDKFPIVLEGLLGMFYDYEPHFEVWVMEEYGVPNSWSKHYNFKLQIDHIMHFKSNGELLFTLYKSGIKCYDAKTNSMKDFSKKYFEYVDNVIYTYEESLLLGCE